MSHETGLTKQVEGLIGDTTEKDLRKTGTRSGNQHRLSAGTSTHLISKQVQGAKVKPHKVKKDASSKKNEKSPQTSDAAQPTTARQTQSKPSTKATPPAQAPGETSKTSSRDLNPGGSNSQSKGSTNVLSTPTPTPTVAPTTLPPANAPATAPANPQLMKQSSIALAPPQATTIVPPLTATGWKKQEEDDMATKEKEKANATTTPAPGTASSKSSLTATGSKKQEEDDMATKEKEKANATTTPAPGTASSKSSLTATGSKKHEEDDMATKEKENPGTASSKSTATPIRPTKVPATTLPITVPLLKTAGLNKQKEDDMATQDKEGEVMVSKVDTGSTRKRKAPEKTPQGQTTSEAPQTSSEFLCSTSKNMRTPPFGAAPSFKALPMQNNGSNREQDTGYDMSSDSDSAVSVPGTTMNKMTRWMKHYLNADGRSVPSAMGSTPRYALIKITNKALPYMEELKLEVSDMELVDKEVNPTILYPLSCLKLKDHDVAWRPKLDNQGHLIPSEFDEKVKTIIWWIFCHHDSSLTFTDGMKFPLADEAVDPKGKFPFNLIKVPGQTEYLDSRYRCCDARVCKKPRERTLEYPSKIKQVDQLKDSLENSFRLCALCGNNGFHNECATDDVQTEGFVCGWCTRPNIPESGEANATDDGLVSDHEGNDEASDIGHCAPAQIPPAPAMLEATKKYKSVLCYVCNEPQNPNHYFEIADHIDTLPLSDKLMCKNGTPQDNRVRSTRTKIVKHCKNNKHRILWEAAGTKDFVEKNYLYEDPDNHGSLYMMAHLVCMHLPPIKSFKILNHCQSIPMFINAFSAHIHVKALDHFENVFKNDKKYGVELKLAGKAETNRRTAFRTKLMTTLEEVNESFQASFLDGISKVPFTREKLDEIVIKAFRSLDADEQHKCDEVAMLFTDRLMLCTNNTD
jgi:hypothetical protein